VTLQRQTPGGWVAVESATTGALGGYRFTQAVASGSWRVRFGGNANHSGGTSDMLVVA
jgi:hypothetical protein